MKRFAGLLIALTLLCGILPAYAAGGICATEENWYVTPHSDDWRVFFYAAVENAGSEPEKINDLLFEIQDAEGTTVESTARYSLYPEILEPGQKGYLVITQDVKDVESREVVDHYTLTVTSKKADDERAVALEASAEYLEEDGDKNKDVLRAAVTNNTQDEAFSIIVAMAARDEAGKLLYVGSAATKDIGLAAGNGLLVRSDIASDIVDALEDAGTKVASVDAVAYTVADTDD